MAQPKGCGPQMGGSTLQVLSLLSGQLMHLCCLRFGTQSIVRILAPGTVLLQYRHLSSSAHPHSQLAPGCKSSILHAEPNSQQFCKRILSLLPSVALTLMLVALQMFLRILTDCCAQYLKLVWVKLCVAPSRTIMQQQLLTSCE